MDVESLREYCIRKPMVEESFPFGEDTLVFKVGGKIFLLCSLDSNPLRFNVKCDPELAIELRERYSCVQPGYHMNKKHWNTIVVDHSVSDNDLREWIDHSYGLVYKPKKR
ncbi:MAG: MmcQ/YjbR family DNA-binding protein [Chitinophagaceae bacterium]|nr:MmcQ/YjbR family DNA-binding protein [Chitinophagaceae bacterium]